jgi:L-ascorbate metabolism protein UlaG (beta-lactamase superfamily)
MISETLFPRWRPNAHVRPTAANPELEPGGFRLRWLGTAGYIVETPKVTVLIDPYISRPSLARVALGKLRVNHEAIERYIPARVDAVCCGHAHFDHLLDAPIIARDRNALFVANATGAAFARAHHVPREKIISVPEHGKTITVGDLEIQFVPSLHGKIFLGRVPFPGTLDIAPPLPARAWHYKMGGAFGIRMQAKCEDGSNGASLYHNGSADLIDAELDNVHADVLLVGLAGRRGTRDYLARLVSHLTPALVVPTHHDAFFAPLSEGVRLLPRIDLPGFLAESRMLAPSATRIVPEYGEEIVVPAKTPRDAKLRAGTGFVI